MPPFILQKIRDEGVGVPYIARFWLGVFQLRDQALMFTSCGLEVARREFDALYEPVLNNLDAARESQKNIARIVWEHRHKLACGEIVTVQPRAVELRESIDTTLREQLALFLNSAARATKAMQHLMAAFGIAIGCLLAKDRAFCKGLDDLRRTGHTVLADYLSRTRSSWSQRLLHRRNALEHDSWSLPRCEYHVAGTSVTLVESQVDGQPVTEYGEALLKYVMAFVEELTMYALKCALPPGLSIAEIPPEGRDPIVPTRFALTLDGASGSAWHLTPTH